MEKKLQRDENSKMIGGVAAGLAEYLNVDVTWVRLGFILAALGHGSGILAYIVLWVAVPKKPFNPFANVTADYKVYDDKTTAQPFATETAGFAPYQQPLKTNRKDNGRLIGGAILIFVGLYFLTDQFDFLPYWFSFHKLWPLALIIPGILMLSKVEKTQAPYQYTPPVDPQTSPDPIKPDADQPLN